MLHDENYKRLFASPGRWPAPYQPAQRYFLLDLQRVAADDLPYRNLLRAFVDWIRQIAGRLAPIGASVPPLRTLEEASMSLVERVAEWPKQWLREGRAQGVAEGREQGREQGLTQGIEQQRALLCRQAAARFDADTAARVAELLAPISDPERLAEVGDWLVRCDTATEFLSRFDSASPA